MSNFEFLKKYQELQYGIMLDEVFDLSFALVSYCKLEKSAFWNQALVNMILSAEEIIQVEKKLKLFCRVPAFYFEDRADLRPFIELLKKRGYKKEFEDSWMFWQDKKIDQSRFDSVKKVSSDEELKIFLDIFDACYQKNDPQNPYGGVSDYIAIAERAWHKYHGINKVEYFLTYKDANPVAVSAITNYMGIGYISNVGSLRKVRGQGYGKIATHYCVERSKRNGNQHHCLATEKGTYPNEFYKRIGFDTLFTALGYTLGSPAKTGLNIFP